MYTLVESRVKGLGCEQEMMEIFEALAIVRTFFTYPSGIPELFQHLSDSCSMHDTHGTRDMRDMHHVRNSQDTHDILGGHVLHDMHDRQAYFAWIA